VMIRLHRARTGCINKQTLGVANVRREQRIDCSYCWSWKGLSLGSRCGLLEVVCGGELRKETMLSLTCPFKGISKRRSLLSS
jgi:hypothetical protein